MSTDQTTDAPTEPRNPSRIALEEPLAVGGLLMEMAARIDLRAFATEYDAHTADAERRGFKGTAAHDRATARVARELADWMDLP